MKRSEQSRYIAETKATMYDPQYNPLLFWFGLGLTLMGIIAEQLAQVVVDPFSTRVATIVGLFMLLIRFAFEVDKLWHDAVMRRRERRKR